ncbi:MAG TPA: hypothetical protein VMA83_11890 [Solirubrobacteraceae bacterium]|nr:hypothetical protein [Solirubrobacteraceae bacterium]
MGETDTSKARRRLPLGRLLLLAVLGAVLALALSESARSTLLDLMFGAEEEFDYSAPDVSAPAPDGAAV